MAVDLSRILKTGFWTFSFRMCSSACALFFVMILTRSMSIESFGFYTLIATIVTFIAMPLGGGLSNLLIRDTANAVGPSQLSTTHGLIRFSFLAGFLFAGTFILITTALRYFELEQLIQIDTLVLVLAAVLLFLTVCISVNMGILSGSKKVVLGQLSGQIVRPALQIVFLALGLLVFFSNDELTAQDVLAIQVLAALMAVGLGLTLVCRNISTDIKSSQPTYSYGFWFSAILPLGSAVILRSININADIFMISGITGNMENVAIYRAGSQPVLLLGAVLSALNVAIAPHIAKMYSEQKLSGIRRLMIFVSVVSGTFSLALAIVFSIYGSELLALLYGEGYSGAQKVLVILLISQVINAVTGPVSLTLNMTHNQNYTLKALIFGAITNILLNAFLIPAYGIEGAAISSAIASCLLNFLLLLYVQKAVFRGQRDAG